MADKFKSHHSKERNTSKPFPRRGELMNFVEAIALSHMSDECLIWPYGKTGQGYGQIWVKGKVLLASRYICERVNGAPPTTKHHAAHSCGNGHLGCVNPKHLNWKTVAENQADRLTHGTHNRGERCANSKLSESQVREILALRDVKSQKEIASEFGVSPSNICHIFRGKSWWWI